MEFQNCTLINFERTHGRTDGQAQSNMPLQLFQSWGYKKYSDETKKMALNPQTIRVKEKFQV